MSTNNKISNLVNSQVPFFVRNDHANFVAFLEAYYRYLEQTEKPISVLRDNLPVGRDIDRTVYEDRLYDEYLKLIPKDTIADRALLLKHIRDFYTARGTEKSMKFLLNVLFGVEDIEFYYPKKDILRASDGKWFIKKTLRVEDVQLDNVANNDFSLFQNFAGKVITGAESGATAVGEIVDRFFENGTQINEISISSIVGTFKNGEKITAYFEGEPIVSSPSSTVTPVYQLTANVFGGIINQINITNAGASYVVGDHVAIESNVGTGAAAVVSKVSAGNVSSITVLQGGSGYRSGDYVLFSGGGGSGANAYISLVDADSSVHPNSYNIIISLLSSEANTNVTNSTSNGVYESFAYQNLRTISTITSNLTANTNGTLNQINLLSWPNNAWKQNSNTFFETYDTLNLTNTITGVSNLVLITSSNILSNLVYISPAFSTPQSNLMVQVIKKANANTSIANACESFVYANTGPAQIISVTSTGAGYISIPDISILGNTRIKELGILGSMEIVNGGSGYVAGDKIEFINIPGGYGSGAAGNVLTVNATGSITNVAFESVAGQIVGGSGYTTLGTPYLPLANVISGTGTGANVIVTTVLGTGGSYIVSNSTLGAIEAITITNRGSGYTSVPTINLTQSGDGTAQAVATIIEGVFEYPGRWLNDDGHLSASNYLENRDYYQPFSYVIRSGVSISKYRKALKDLTHPAGMKLFGAYVLYDNQEDYINIVSADDGITGKKRNKTFGKIGNTINVFYSSHGLLVGNTVTLEFLSGNYKNVKNGIYTVTSANTNYFSVKQPRGAVQSISIVNAGLNYTSNSYIIFTTDYGQSNGTYNINASGSIVSVSLNDFGRYYNNVPKANADGSNSVAAVFSVVLDQYANNDSGNVYVSITV